MQNISVYIGKTDPHEGLVRKCYRLFVEISNSDRATFLEAWGDRDRNPPRVALELLPGGNGVRLRRGRGRYMTTSGHRLRLSEAEVGRVKWARDLPAMALTKVKAELSHDTLDVPLPERIQPPRQVHRRRQQKEEEEPARSEAPFTTLLIEVPGGDTLEFAVPPALAFSLGADLAPYRVRR